MKYGSVCSGIEAATVAWDPLGWKPQWLSETEAFPSEILNKHYPEIKNYGDFTKIGSEAGGIDVLVGGTPCQSFSVAGRRAGLDDPRGNLSLEFVRLAKRLRPRWVVWENVPGVLSIDKGRTFGEFLQALEECGYGWTYRVLNAQYFGVPQRRRRVFVVGYLGDFRRAAAVLLERESMSGNPAPRRTKGKVSPTLPASGVGPSRTGNERTESEFCITNEDVAKPLGAHTSSGWRGDLDHETYVTFEPMVAFAQNSRDEIRFQGGDGQISGAINAEEVMKYRTYLAYGGNNTNGPINVSTAVNAHGGSHGRLDFESETFIVPRDIVRRLTPVECERLQGFPDNYTRISWRGKETEDCPDGPRYRAIGNSMAVPVMQWIGKRMELVEGIING